MDFKNDPHKHHEPLNPEEKNKNRRIMTKLKERLSHIGRKMSKGAADIYRTARNKCKWGNKQLFKSGDKGNQKRD